MGETLTIGVEGIVGANGELTRPPSSIAVEITNVRE